VSAAVPDPVPLRLGFNQVPELYDRIRPTYPAELFDEVFAHLAERPALVEVGPGTGQATVELVGRGARVVAVEPGNGLARVLRRKLPGDELEILVTTFEDADLADARFDGVVSASAYHWVPPPHRVDTPARILRPGGLMILIDVNQVESPVDRGYFARARPIYDRYGRGLPGFRLHTPDDVVPEHVGDFVRSERFDPPRLFRYRWDQVYSASEYADLKRTDSGSLAMQAAEREAMIADLSQLVTDEFGGSITRPIVVTLMLATRRSP